MNKVNKDTTKISLCIAATQSHCCHKQSKQSHQQHSFYITDSLYIFHKRNKQAGSYYMLLACMCYICMKLVTANMAIYLFTTTLFSACSGPVHLVVSVLLSRDHVITELVHHKRTGSSHSTFAILTPQR